MYSPHEANTCIGRSFSSFRFVETLLCNRRAISPCRLKNPFLRSQAIPVPPGFRGKFCWLIGLNACSILLVEDDLVSSVALSTAIRMAVPDALIMNARSLAEARLVLMLGEFKITVFILDINLPDGSGMDFILEATLANHQALIVMITNTPLPEFRERAEAFGVVNFFAKPVDSEKLIALIKENQSRAAVLPASDKGSKTVLETSLNRLKRLVGFEETTSPAKDGETTLFRASLSQLAVLDIIQLKCLNKVTQGILFKSSKHGVARVFFKNGDIIHAESKRFVGMAALSDIVGWKGGEVEELSNEITPQQTISGSWQNTLLMAVHNADHKRPA